MQSPLGREHCPKHARSRSHGISMCISRAVQWSPYCVQQVTRHVVRRASSAINFYITELFHCLNYLSNHALSNLFENWRMRGGGGGVGVGVSVCWEGGGGSPSCSTTLARCQSTVSEFDLTKLSRCGSTSSCSKQICSSHALCILLGH